MDKDTLISQYEEHLRHKTKVNKILYWILQSFTLATAIASVVTYFVQDKGLETTLNQIFMCVLAFLCFNIPIIAEKRFKIIVPTYITNILYIFIFAHFVLGEVLRVYDHSVVFDKVLHTTWGVIMAFIGFSFVLILSRSNPNKIQLSPFFLLLFSFCITMTTEYIWEIFEYAVDRIFNANMQRWKDGVLEYLADGSVLSSVPHGSGVDDIMGDMIVNIIGCFAVCVYIGIGIKFNPHWFSNKVILTSSQVRTMAEAFAEQEIAKSQNSEFSQKTESLSSDELSSSDFDEIVIPIDIDDETLIN